MKLCLKSTIATVATLAIVACAPLWSQTTASADAASFPPLEQWKTAVLAHDPAGLQMLYSTDPATMVSANKVKGDAQSDISFWLGLKARGIKLQVIGVEAPRPEIAQVIFQADVATGLPDGQTVTVADSQVWLKRADQWRLVYVTRTDAPHLQQPSDMKKDLYPADADAAAEIKEAENKAAKDHKRVLLVFGANWCYDCHVLDLAFHRPDFASVMAGYEVVHVDIGDDGKKNADIASRFQVPLDKGIPTLAVLESDGTVVVSQKNGEFENARGLTPQALLEFLNKWKMQAR